MTGAKSRDRDTFAASQAKHPPEAASCSEAPAAQCGPGPGKWWRPSIDTVTEPLPIPGRLAVLSILRVRIDQDGRHGPGIVEPQVKVSDACQAQQQARSFAGILYSAGPGLIGA